MAENMEGMPIKDTNTKKIIMIKVIRLTTNNRFYLDCDWNNKLGLFKKDDEEHQLPISTQWKVLWKQGNTCQLMSCYGSLLTFRDEGPAGLTKVQLEPRTTVYGVSADWHVEILKDSRNSAKVFVARIRSVENDNWYLERSGNVVGLGGILTNPSWIVQVVDSCSVDGYQPPQPQQQQPMPPFTKQLSYHNVTNTGSGSQTVGGDSIGHNARNYTGWQRIGDIHVTKAE